MDPAQATPKPKLKSPSLSTNKTPRSLLNTPVHHQTPIKNTTPSLTPGTQQKAHQQTPVRSKPISKIPSSSAYAVSRKLIQKSVKMLNAPKHKLVSRPCPEVTPNVKLFSSTDISTHQGNENLESPQLKIPIAPMSKLSHKQALLPQENPFDINSELIPYQEKEVEAVFKALELDDFFYLQFWETKLQTQL